MTLKASEVRFWQEAYLLRRSVGGWFADSSISEQCAEAADAAVLALRTRIETPEPLPAGPMRTAFRDTGVGCPPKPPHQCVGTNGCAAWDCDRV